MFAIRSGDGPVPDIVEHAGPTTAAPLQAIWQRDVLPLCRTAIDNAYPFVKISRRDAAIADVDRLFSPGGIFDRFWTAHLAAHADTTTSRWRWKTEPLEPLSPVTATFFQQVSEIRAALFGNDGKLGIDVGVKPNLLSSHAASVTLTHGDAQIRYSHGPQSWKTLAWPATGSTTRQHRLHRSARYPQHARGNRTVGTVQAARDGQARRGERPQHAAGLVPRSTADAEFQFRLRSGKELATKPMAGLRCPEKL